MSAGLKAIETHYKPSYRFRSRLEARWAVFFDALGYEWEYEVEAGSLSLLGAITSRTLLPLHQKVSYLLRG